MKANLNLAIYCRVSSDEQKTGGNIHRQIEQAAIEIQRLGLLGSDSRLIYRNPRGTCPADQYFIDEAYNLEEIREGTAFYDLLGLCRSGEVNAIYVDNIDRIFRSRSHTVRGQIMDLLEEYDIQIHTPTGHVNNGLVLQFMSAIGAEDKKQTLRKLHIGKKYKVQNEGRPPNGRAFWGFDFDKTANKWLIVEDEAKVVRWAAAMSAGRILNDMPPSLKLLVEENPNGVSDKVIIEGFDLVGVNLINYFKRNNFRDAERKNPTGKLPRNWLSNIYRDDRYTGQHIYRLKPVAHVGRKASANSERETITVKIPVIVSAEDWELAKASRQTRSCKSHRHPTQEYLLHGLVHCGVCGEKMGARARHHDYYKVSKKSVVKNIAKYYVCQTKASGKKGLCSHKTCHSSSQIDSQIWDRIVSYLKTDVIARVQNKSRSTDHITKDIKKLQSEIQQLDINNRDVEQEKSRFLVMLGKGHLSEDDWIAQRERLEKDLKHLQIQKLKLEQHIKIHQKQIVDIKANTGDAKVLGEYQNKLDNLTFSERKQLCDLVVHKVLVYADRNVELFLKK